MRLIVNGDDFGLTPGVSKGIVDSIKNGIMGDTTAMANMKYFNESIQLAKDNGINEMGIHLTLTCGKPTLSKEQIPSLVQENGEFLKLDFLEENPHWVKLEEIEKEFRAQIKVFLQSGMKLNHIDSHHHVHSFSEEIFTLVVKLAAENNIPVRCAMNRYYDIADNFNVKHPDNIVDDFFGDNISEEYFISRLEDSLKSNYDVVEIMAHPAYIDSELKQISSYIENRELELEVYKSERVKKFLKDKNIEVINFSQI